MIILEDRLKEIFDQLPAIVVDSVSYNPKFSFGDQKELNSFLKAHSKSDSVYPLIWLAYPNRKSKNRNGKEIRSKIKLILAVQNDSSSWLNDQRFKTMYKSILYPLYDSIEKAFNGTKIARITGNDFDFIEHEEKPNFGDKDSNSKHYTTDIWDALTMEFEVIVNNCKIDNINF